MTEAAPDLNSRIGHARARILKLFVEQVSLGKQSENLSPEAAACGQFVGEGAQSLRQRGGHGTAAALRVLAESDDAEAKKLVPLLVAYVDEREKLDSRNLSADGAHVARQKCDVDSKNVIKVSEILFSLCQVPHGGSHNAERLIKKLADQLAASRRRGEIGWSYFTDDPVDTPLELLPTAYAVLALSYTSISIDKEIRYLTEQMKKRHLDENKSSAQSTDIITDIACLYAITFRRSTLAQNGVDRDVRELVQRIWTRLDPIFGEDFEQNVEYWRHFETFYVRIPWQLYLLALIAHHRFPLFCSKAAQRRLSAILTAVEDKGFRYPHSGSMISSRTNAILFEVLGQISNEWRPGARTSMLILLDQIRSFAGSRTTRWIVLSAIGMVIAYSIYKWLMTKASWEELGPELTVAILLFIIELARKR